MLTFMEWKDGGVFGFERFMLLKTICYLSSSRLQCLRKKILNAQPFEDQAVIVLKYGNNCWIVVSVVDNCLGFDVVFQLVDWFHVRDPNSYCLSFSVISLFAIKNIPMGNNIHFCRNKI